MTDDEIPISEKPVVYEGPAIGALGITLIGGAVAAAIGLLITFPLFRLRAKAKTTSKPKPPADRVHRKSRQ